jgi:hypothetical protein
MFKRKARKDEYESDGIDDEEDVDAQKRKRAAARAKVKRTPAAAAAKRVAEGGSSTWHHLFQASASPYQRLLVGADWSTCSATALDAALAATGSSVARAVALWLESTNKALTLPKDRAVLDAVRAVPGGEQMLAVMGLFYAVRSMPDYAEEAANHAETYVPDVDFDVPFHWEEAAFERAEMWRERSAAARNVLAPKLRKCDAAIRTALRDHGDETMRTKLVAAAFQ